MNTRKFSAIFLPLTLFIALSTNVSAESSAKAGDKEAVVINLTLKRVVTDAKGKEKFEEAPKIKPGEVVEYRAVYRNKSKDTVKGLIASLPVPVGLEYIKQTANPNNVQATADGIKFEKEPLMRTVKDANGVEKQEEVPYIEYRSLRWDVGELGAGKKVEVSARMRASELPKSPEQLVTQPPASATVK